MGDFYTIVFLLAGKTSRVPVDRWITSESFHDLQNANRCCTGHPTMSTERGNYRLITVHAPFLAIAPNQKSPSNCCMEALSHWPEMKNSGRCSHWVWYLQKVLSVFPCWFNVAVKWTVYVSPGSCIQVCRMWVSANCCAIWERIQARTMQIHKCRQ